MTDPFINLNRARQQATGTQFDVTVPTLAPTCRSKADFDQLVSAYYKFFREELALDIAVLRKVSNGPKVAAFDGLLKALRTDAQHTGNPRDTRRAQEFRNRHGDWSKQGVALADLLGEALSEVALVAVSVSRSPEEAATWKAAVALDLGAVFDGVLADMALNFPDWRRSQMQREISTRLRRRNPSADTYIAVAQDLCVQEITSETAELPVPYHRVLDALGLLATPQAQAAVLVAYSVAVAAPDLSGEDFVSRVIETWHVASR